MSAPAPLFYALTGDVMLNGPRPSFIPPESHGPLLHELHDRITAANRSGDTAAARAVIRTAAAFIEARRQANIFRRRARLPVLNLTH